MLRIFDIKKMAALIAHMSNMWSCCQGANDELMEGNRQKSIRGRREKQIQKIEEEEEEKHLNEPPRSSRKRNAFFYCSKQTDQAEEYVRHLQMFIGLANRNCSLV
jgi:hypothetical protein